MPQTENTSTEEVKLPQDILVTIRKYIKNFTKMKQKCKAAIKAKRMHADAIPSHSITSTYKSNLICFGRKQNSERDTYIA